MNKYLQIEETAKALFPACKTVVKDNELFIHLDDCVDTTIGVDWEGNVAFIGEVTMRTLAQLLPLMLCIKEELKS